MTMGMTLFFLFVLYTIACCMDGPDLKPLWKRWLGKKLEGYADSLYPIDYCVKGKCKHYKESFEYYRVLLRYNALKKEYDDFKKNSLFAPCVEVSYYDIKRIEEAFILREGDLFEARMNEEMAERRGIPLWQLPIPHYMTVDGIVNRTKETCLCKILDSAKQFVTIEEDRESCYPEIIVRGSLNIGVKR